MAGHGRIRGVAGAGGGRNSSSGQTFLDCPKLGGGLLYSEKEGDRKVRFTLSKVSFNTKSFVNGWWESIT